MEYGRLRVIISGGGTGGHIFPALSIANKLK
jgi:UDP-N-acetylglucosamine--N-acetylmuramyl-(pentapeptide) pyrophosphoryl-undecaprenol N-acetylglucosamine transferase